MDGIIKEVFICLKRVIVTIESPGHAKERHRHVYYYQYITPGNVYANM